MEKLRTFCLTAQPLGGRAGMQVHGACCSVFSSQSSTTKDCQVLRGGLIIHSSFSLSPALSSSFLSLIFFPSFSFSFIYSFFHLSSSFPLPSFSLPPFFPLLFLILCFTCFVIFIFSLGRPGQTIDNCRRMGLSYGV